MSARPRWGCACHPSWFGAAPGSRAARWRARRCRTRLIAAGRWLLLDKSAFARTADLDGALGEPCLCAITRFEVLYSARSAVDFEQIEAELDVFHELRTDAETFAIARTAQRELAALGQHRVPTPDLLIGACAQQHQAAVLHVDRHYETLAQVLSFTPVRLRA
jgi:predicted nucleic acid-binding protein